MQWYLMILPRQCWWLLVTLDNGWHLSMTSTAGECCRSCQQIRQISPAIGIFYKLLTDLAAFTSCWQLCQICQTKQPQPNLTQKSIPNQIYPIKTTKPNRTECVRCSFHNVRLDSVTVLYLPWQIRYYCETSRLVYVRLAIPIRSSNNNQRVVTQHVW